ncbi:hypothetical protein BKA80DRAFT_317131 [Phyllosticta citrichinensis]
MAKGEKSGAWFAPGCAKREEKNGRETAVSGSGDVSRVAPSAVPAGFRRQSSWPPRRRSRGLGAGNVYCCPAAMHGGPCVGLSVVLPPFTNILLFPGLCVRSWFLSQSLVGHPHHRALFEISRHGPRPPSPTRPSPSPVVFLSPSHPVSARPV